MGQPRFRPEFTRPDADHSRPPTNGAPVRGPRIVVEPANGRHAGDDEPGGPVVYGPGGELVVFVPDALVGQVSDRRGDQVDYDDVRLLRRQVSEQLTLWLRGRGEVPDDERQRERDRLARELVREMADTRRRTGTPLSRADEQ